MCAMSLPRGVSVKVGSRHVVGGVKVVVSEGILIILDGTAGPGPRPKT